MSTGIVLSVVVAAVVAWIIGALWYSPFLFANAWVKAHGHTPEKLAAMQAKAGKTYAATLVAMIVMAAVLRILLSHLGVDSWGDGAGWAFHVWLGIALPLGFIAHLYSDKSWSAFLIDTGYQLVYLTAMGAILGAWH